MGKKLIRYVVYAIAMCAIGGVTGYLHNRDSAGNDTGQDSVNYVLKLPRALAGIFLAVLIIGMFSFVFVAVSRFMGTPTATIGLIRVSLGFAAVGLVMMLWVGAWRITVTGDRMEIHRFLRRTQTAEFTKLERVEVTKRFQLVLYKEGRKLATVDLLAENYDRFADTLRKYGKLDEQAAEK
ncbi:MAG: hypothetical protein LUG99_02600 [Lachnospiraceae bacterium]|nr:hypothetical protein [Lachnospiraceae bacterium]